MNLGGILHIRQKVNSSAIDTKNRSKLSQRRSVIDFSKSPGSDFTDIHWVIVGGESGWGARPVKIEWIREIFKACRKQNVPFFFKQWGGVRKDLTGRLLRGRTYDEMPVRVAA